MDKLLNQIMTELQNDPYFSNFKIRKRDASLYRTIDGGKEYIELQHRREYGFLDLFPIYSVRFDKLSKWFEKFSFKSLQDQRDGSSISFCGEMLSQQDRFEFRLDGYNYQADFNNLNSVLKSCSKYVFETYSTMQKLYDRTIIPVLNGTKELPSNGADWIAIDLALCKIVAPERLEDLKKIIFERAAWMHSRNEPNIGYYYDRLDEIYDYLLSIDLT